METITPEFHEKYPQLGAALDLLLDDMRAAYTADRAIIFKSASESAGLLHERIAASAKAWKKSKACLVPGCGKASIARSHGLPRAMSLSAIAEGGKVLTPHLDRQKRRVTPHLEGQYDASTFPGFCSEHELLFESFETGGVISTRHHLILQAYRVICREQFRSEYFIKHTNATIAKYESLRDQRLLEWLRSEVPKRGLPSDLNLKSVKISSDDVVEEASKRIRVLSEWNAQVTSMLLPAFERAVFQSDESEIHIESITLSYQVPVALHGTGSFLARSGTEIRRHSIIICCVPSTTETVVFIAGHVSQADALREYAKYSLGNDLAALSIIESWMVHGSDQWYLKPSIWNSLDDGRKTAVEDQIFSTDEDIAKELTYSIFNELRSKLVVAYEELNNPAATGLIESQKAKLVINVQPGARDPHF